MHKNIKEPSRFEVRLWESRRLQDATDKFFVVVVQLDHRVAFSVLTTLSGKR